MGGRLGAPPVAAPAAPPPAAGFTPAAVGAPAAEAGFMMRSP